MQIGGCIDRERGAGLLGESRDRGEEENAGVENRAHGRNLLLIVLEMDRECQPGKLLNQLFLDQNRAAV
jgi:hypothetical protein